jgi:hypothetical protein
MKLCRNTCLSEQCNSLVKHYCFTHQGFVCEGCCSFMHRGCYTLDVKTEVDIALYLERLDQFMGKVERICGLRMADIMVKGSSGVVMGFVERYYERKKKILDEIGEGEEDINLTVRFDELQSLHGEMKDNEEYAKV